MIVLFYSFFLIVFLSANFICGCSFLLELAGKSRRLNEGSKHLVASLESKFSQDKITKENIQRLITQYYPSWFIAFSKLGKQMGPHIKTASSQTKWLICCRTQFLLGTYQQQNSEFVSSLKGPNKKRQAINILFFDENAQSGQGFWKSDNAGRKFFVCFDFVCWWFFSFFLRFP